MLVYVMCISLGRYSSGNYDIVINQYPIHVTIHTYSLVMIQCGCIRTVLFNTVRCRYTAVQFNAILYTALQLLGLYINQNMSLQKASLTGELWGAFCQDFWEFCSIITALCCTTCILISSWKDTFSITGTFWWETSGYQWFPHTKGAQFGA